MSQVRVLYRPLVKTCRTLYLRHLSLAGSATFLLTDYLQFGGISPWPKRHPSILCTKRVDRLSSILTEGLNATPLTSSECPLSATVSWSVSASQPSTISRCRPESRTDSAMPAKCYMIVNGYAGRRISQIRFECDLVDRLVRGGARSSSRSSMIIALTRKSKNNLAESSLEIVERLSKQLANHQDQNSWQTIKTTRKRSNENSNCSNAPSCTLNRLRRRQARSSRFKAEHHRDHAR